MNKMLKRGSLLAVLFFVFASVALVSCSKDDDNSPSGGIDAAVGTYVGTIDMLDANGTKHYNAEIVVTKVDDTHLKIAAKSGEVYSNVTTKTVQASGNMGVSVQSNPNDPNGLFLYMVKEKTVSFVTKDTQPNDVIYSFEGTKK